MNAYLHMHGHIDVIQAYISMFGHANIYTHIYIYVSICLSTYLHICIDRCNCSSPKEIHMSMTATAIIIVYNNQRRPTERMVLAVDFVLTLSCCRGPVHIHIHISI